MHTVRCVTVYLLWIILICFSYAKLFTVNDGVYVDNYYDCCNQVYKFELDGYKPNYGSRRSDFEQIESISELNPSTTYYTLGYTGIRVWEEITDLSNCVQKTKLLKIDDAWEIVIQNSEPLFLVWFVFVILLAICAFIPGASKVFELPYIHITWWFPIWLHLYFVLFLVLAPMFLFEKFPKYFYE